MAKIIQSTDVIYQDKLGLTLDVYRNQEQQNGGALIDLHGGGWFRGDKAKDRDLAMQLAQLGYLVVVPNYRLTPLAYFPEPIEDVAAVVEWLRQSREIFDLQRIGAIGSSAGGNLAIELAIRYGIPAVSWSGIIEIDDWLEAHKDVVAAADTKQDFVKTASAKINQSGANDSFYKWFVLNYLKNNVKQAGAASLVHRLSATTGPLFLANSLNEFVPTAGVLNLQRRLVELGVPTMTKLMTGSEHAKGYLERVMPATQVFLAEFV
ncbi:esterase [Loigolactobacillus backii]|uniref:alpha/beta hydrolase family protein n=1 Tax=Loigolactobacillus backii TaxID=375175 RepID=UPI000C1CBAC4|nr:alpha/beta hydrolase [Loigolactobacillus backii]PIO82537.1 esterase [Loigolactobacillus backii]